jgi:hypothetical protein
LAKNPALHGKPRSFRVLILHVTIKIEVPSGKRLLGQLGSKILILISDCWFLTIYPDITYPPVNVYITRRKITMLFMGKSTISTGPFSSSQTVTNYQRVNSNQMGLQSPWPGCSGWNLRSQLGHVCCWNPRGFFLASTGTINGHCGA